VKTYLALLVQKRHLKTARVGNSFLYEPRLTLWQSLRSAADRLLEKTLAGSEGPLLTYLIQNARLDDKEIAELRATLDDISRAGNRASNSGRL
jgi:predicted transcriptional regulator